MVEVNKPESFLRGGHPCPIFLNNFKTHHFSMETKQQNSFGWVEPMPKCWNFEFFWKLFYRRGYEKKNTNIDVKLANPIRVAPHGVACGILLFKYLIFYSPNLFATPTVPKVKLSLWCRLVKLGLCIYLCVSMYVYLFVFMCIYV